MTDIDFEEQLKQEELAKEKESQGSLTRVEDDGSVMEWDSTRRAWFPKIDDDFIAKYQMSYGSHEMVESQETPAPETYSEEDYKNYSDYYNYYYQQYQNADQTESQSSDATETIPSKRAGEPDYDHYFDQYKQDFEQGYKIEDHKEPEVEKKSNSKKKEKKKKEPVPEPRPEGWFEVEDDKNTNVYVSGLPTDITDEEYNEVMAKCGLIMFDPFTKKPKLKLYKDENGQPKGDGRCCYIKVESVHLALQLLDDSELRGHRIHVEKAQFQLKGNFDPNKKRKKLNNKEKRKYKEKQAKLFDWRPEKTESARLKFEKVVILKNMFDPKDFEEDPLLINELRDDVRTECSKIGDCKKVVIYDRHPDGVMSATFKDAETADMCVESLNHRWFAKRRIIAQTWDGVTKYEIEETEAEREIRMKKWENFLVDSEENKKIETPSEENKNEIVKDNETKKTDNNITDNAECAQPAMDITDQQENKTEILNITEDVKVQSEKEQSET